MNKIKYFIIALAGLLAASCVGNDVFEEITSVPLRQCLEPMNLKARVDENTGVDVRFSWDKTSDAEGYVFDLTTIEDGTRVHYDTLAPNEIPFTLTLEADVKLTFTVQAVAKGREPSKVAAYDGTISTHAIVGNLFPELTGKTSSTVSISWSKDAADYQDVTHFELTPVGGKTTKVDIDDDGKAAAAFTLTGLNPSTEYDIVLCFKSASRGALTVWTDPAQGTMTKVTTLDELKAAMTAGGDIYLGTEGSPYIVSAFVPTKGFRIFGETGADGKRPVIQTLLTMSAAMTDETFYFENVGLTGGYGSHSYIMQKADGGDETLTMKCVNCEIFGYTSGLVNQNKNGNMVFTELAFENCDMYDIAGGEGVNIRKNAEIKNFVMKNNTIWDSFTCFIRLDSGVKLGSVVFENNLLKSNSLTGKGIFYIRCSSWTSISLKKNLLLWEDGAATEFFATDNSTPGSIDAADNYAYQVGEKFFNKLPAADAKCTVLTADPCFNSKGNVFNLSNSDLQEKQVGPAKWWNAYVEPVEDLYLGLTETPHTWDLTDATLFAGDCAKSKVRDSLLIVASDACPMNLDGAITFKAAGVVNKKGVPSDGYVAFKVATAGSVVLKVEDPSSLGSQVLVAMGPADGSAASVKGGSFAGTNKVILSGISDETMVYLYPTGPCKLSKLAWSADMSAVNTALPTPTVTLSTDKVEKGESTAITASWNAVPGAAAYEVTFDGVPETVTATSYVIAADVVAGLKAGGYTVAVVAKPAATDIYNTASAPGVAAFTVSGADTVEPVSYVWDFASAGWQAALLAQAPAAKANKEATNWSVTYDGLTFNAVSKSQWQEAGFIQPGGKSNTSKSDRVFTFTAPVAGKLTVTASHTGDTAATDHRTVGVIDSVKTQFSEELDNVFATGTHKACEFNVAAGDITIYCPVNGLRFYKIEFQE